MASVGPPNLSFIAAVTIGGAIGSVARYLTWHYCAGWFGTVFPWGTLAVNVFGCLWIGFFGTTAVVKPEAIAPALRFLLTTGFAGGLTTFSSFAFETLGLVERGDPHLGVIYVAANLILGGIAVVCGAFLARAF